MAWTLRRLLVSAFVVLHLAAVVVWILPACAIKERLVNYTAYYLMPTAQWQYWGMFAPDPVKDTVFLEAYAIDAHGLLHRFSFPRESDMSPWRSMWFYRHSKYSASYSLKDEFAPFREFGARHVCRELKLPADAYPVDVQLFFLIRRTPPPGGKPDPMAPPLTAPIETFRFPTIQEIQE